MANPFSALYRAYAVPEDYDGPLAREFHDLIARQWLAGMRRGHTTLGPTTRVEEIVRYHLSADWQKRVGLTFAIRNLDHPTFLDRLQFKWCRFKRLFLTDPYELATIRASHTDQTGGK